MSKHTPGPCGAVFRIGVNTPASCALRFNHPGHHRNWQQVADERTEFLEALRSALPHFRQLATVHGEEITSIEAAIANATGGES